MRELIRRVNNLATGDRENRFDALDFFLGYRKIIVGERNEVRQLARRNRPLRPGFARKPTAALGVKPKRFFAREPVFFGIHGNAADGFAAAHEKALQSLVDNPADLKQPVEWVQALAAVHARFIEEATDALVKTAGEAVPATGVLDEVEAQRIRGLNQQVLARASAAGAGAVDGYEKALQDMADFETKIAGTSQLDWLQAVARSHTKFVTDLASMYANAIRNGLSG